MPLRDDTQNPGTPAAGRNDTSGEFALSPEATHALSGLVPLSERHQVPGVDPDSLRIQLSDLDLVPSEMARQHGVLPVLQTPESLFLAMVAPGDKKAIDDVEFVSGRKVVPFVAEADRLRALIDRAYAARAEGESVLVGPRALSGATPSLAPKASPQVMVPPPPATPPTGVPGAVLGRISLTPGRSKAGPPALPSPTASVRPQTPGGTPAYGMPALRSPLPPSVSVPPPPPMPPSARGPVGQGLFAPMRSPSVPPERGQSTMSKLPSVAPTGKLVWVVDADGASREALREALSELGHSVVALDSVAALMARQGDGRRPDMVVLDPTDATDPDDGLGRSFGQLAALREDPAWQRVRWVMLSSRWAGWRAGDDLAESLGVQALLPKPLSLVDTVPRVEALLDGQHPGRPPEVLPPAVDQALVASTEAYQRGDAGLAVSVVEQALAVPSNVDGFPRLRYHLGLLLGRRGEVFRAITMLEAAVEGDETFFPALKNLGVLYERVGFRRKALEAWERAFFVAPDAPTQQQIQERIVALLKPE